jgi:methionyl-tRNA formyltransferase
MLRNKITGDPWYDQHVALDTLLEPRTQVVSCRPEQASDFGNELPAHAVEELTEVDIAVRFDFGILKSDALTAPTHGILSYHHGDLSSYRGQPAGFYELIHGRPTAGVTVQRLINDLDGGVLAETYCDIKDAKSLREVHNRQFAASPPLLTEAVKRTLQ